MRAILLFFIFTNLYANDLRLRFCFEHQNLFPYYLGNSLSVQEKNPGVAIEELDMLAKSYPHVKVEYIRAPWERCKKFLYSGLADAVVASYKDVRAQSSIYPHDEKNNVDKAKYVANSSTHFYKLRNTKITWDGSNFVNYEGQKIGFIAGHSAKCFIKKHGLIGQKYYTIKKALSDLKKNKIAAVIMLTMPTDYEIDKNPEFRGIVKSNNPVEIKKYYLVFSKPFYKRHKDVAEKLWQNYVGIRKNYTIDLIKKYFVFKDYSMLETYA